MKLTGKDSNPRKTFYEFAQDTDGCGNNTDTGWLPCQPENCERQDHFALHRPAPLPEPDPED